MHLYAFDILLLDGDDLRRQPLLIRKRHLARVLERQPDWLFVARFEQGEIGPDLFQAACEMGLEGMVSKRADRPCRAGLLKDWVKVKDRKHPAYGVSCARATSRSRAYEYWLGSAENNAAIGISLG